MMDRQLWRGKGVLITGHTVFKGGEATWRLDGEHHRHEATYLRLGCSKARARLGWRPRCRLVRVLEATTRWYRVFYVGEEVRALALNLTRQPYLIRYEFRVSVQLTNTNRVMQDSIWIGHYLGLDDAMVEFLATKLDSFLG